MTAEEFEWGFKEKIFYSEDACYVDLLRVRPLGYSSIHSHEYQRNRLYLISGNFLVYEYNNEVEARRDLILTYNQPSIAIPPKMIHQFWNPSRTEWATVLEIVTGKNLSRDDIFRYSERGVGTP